MKSDFWLIIYFLLDDLVVIDILLLLSNDDKIWSKRLQTKQSIQIVIFQ